MVSTATLAVAGAVPIAVAFVLLVGLRWSAVRAMGVGWVLATALGLTIWGMNPSWWVASAVFGALQAVNIILIVFGAILLMNYLDGSGAISTIRWYFTQIESDRRVQLLLIGLGFETIIEGAAGFGTPGALAAPLFIGLGFPPLAAAVFGLFFNAPNPPFGAAGTPILGGVGAVMTDGLLPQGVAVSEFLEMVSAWTGVITGVTYVFWGFLGVVLLIYWFGDDGERSVRGALRTAAPVAPFAFVLGIVAGGVQWAVAWFIGPALPDIAAGFVVLGIGMVMANRDVLVPEDRWDFPDSSTWNDTWRGGLDLDEIAVEKPSKEMPVLLAWTPYLLVAALLLITRWPTLTIGGRQIVDVVSSFTVGFDVLGYEQLHWAISYLYLPGTFPFLPIAVLTGFLHGMDVDGMRDAWRESVDQTIVPALTLIVAVSMTQIMIQSKVNPADVIGMMQALSRGLATIAGGLLPIISPWIGALGAFMTGSNTSSDILFSVLQYNAAGQVGISQTVTVALQNTGGGIGNMISVLNLAAIGGVAGVAGREGDMMRKTIVPTVIFALWAGLLGLIFVYVAPGGSIPF
ncbi:L-lactate permease [Halobellus sp. EA9]|uniref:L-lactate permease n=1 Tax=Halobellus sp. EA9 TaxID=3421647 RepID=UPI003EB9AE43